MIRPFEVDQAEYPFRDNGFPYREGYVHYLDEGEGPAILLLHGNPTWSYLYRNIVKELRRSCRLVAPDYPGFGMSKAPTGYGFTPAEHAEAIEALIAHLGLRDLVVVGQDWGGSIGMSYAVRHPENLRGIVMMNSWAWPATPRMKVFSLLMGGWPLGHWLQTRKNFFARKIVPFGIYHKEKITERLTKAYTDPFPTPASRVPTWIFPRQIRKARSWLAELEARLPKLRETPAQILWGAKDTGFPPDQMATWQGYLKLHETEVLDDAAHYVQEDRPDRVAAAIRRALERTAQQRR